MKPFLKKLGLTGFILFVFIELLNFFSSLQGTEDFFKNHAWLMDNILPAIKWLNQYSHAIETLIVFGFMLLVLKMMNKIESTDIRVESFDDYLHGNKEYGHRDMYNRFSTSIRNHDADILFLSSEADINRNAFLNKDTDKDLIKENIKSAVICLVRAIMVEKENKQFRNIKLYMDKLGTLLNKVDSEDLLNIKAVYSIDIITLCTELDAMPEYRNLQFEIKGIKSMIYSIFKNNKPA